MYFVLVHYYIQNGIFVKSTTQPLVRRLAINLIQAERYESVFEVCKLNFFSLFPFTMLSVKIGEMIDMTTKITQR